MFINIFLIKLFYKVANVVNKSFKRKIIEIFFEH